MIRWTLTLAVIVASSLVAASAANAGSLQIADGTVVFTATPGEVNHVVMRESGGPTFSDAAAPLAAGPGCEQLDAYTARCAEGDGTRDRPVAVWAADGDDSVSVIAFSRYLSLHGGKGDDGLYSSKNNGGSGAELDGGPGDDLLTDDEQLGGTSVLRGGPGDDSLRIVWYTNLGGRMYGGDGDDELFYQGAPDRGPFSPLVLAGENGNDTYRFQYDFIPNAMVPGSGLDTLDESTSSLPDWRSFSFDFDTCPGCVERVIGTPNADRITGDDGVQAILGGGGDDVLDGGGGPDVISGQAGDDQIDSRDGQLDLVGCGAGLDAVTSDRKELVDRSCENVDRAKWSGRHP